MEFNEISMCMDVKLDIYDKRPDSLKLKTWTKCQVKIEAIKCLPCFLRINFHSLPEDDQQESVQLSVSINVPGVTISLATSRTKQHSYGLFWTHNRRNCFIYFALETEKSCRQHMKWIKKSIKNLELYRQVFLEQRRNSRVAPILFGESRRNENRKKELSAVKDALFALGPLPQIPDANNSINWSRRVSRVSEIYEEIHEGSYPPHLSRRLSRTSIASGIYEEMKLYSSNLLSTVEEQLNCPPPVPPLPPHRKRLNTSETDPFAFFDDRRHDNCTAEPDLAKKKKCKNVFDNIFGAGRPKRAESASETHTCSMEDLINEGASIEEFQPIYANDILQRSLVRTNLNKRQSFSSPDLSKINFLHTFDEDKVAALLYRNNSSDLDVYVDDDLEGDVGMAHNYSSLSLDDSAVVPSYSLLVMNRLGGLKSKSDSMQSLNVSNQLSRNFNFSACNTSSINLVGANGAVPSTQRLTRNKIVSGDDLTGYCVMAPIIRKRLDNQETTTTTTSSTTSTTSGYSTGSYYSSSSSTTSSNTQVTENKDLLPMEMLQKPQEINDNNAKLAERDYDEVPLRKPPLPVTEADTSNIYETLRNDSPLNGSSELLGHHENTPPLNRDFTGNLYENLLTIKAAQELEQPLPPHICTSTPTDSPADNPISPTGLEEEQNFYQTPRKSVISVDDKIPSYYPNSCDTVRMRRRSNSPSNQTTPTTTLEKPTSKVGLKHLMSIKMRRERKENLYVSSPQKIMEQRMKFTTNLCSTLANTKKSANAQKISENVYTVNLANKKTLKLNNNNTHVDNKNAEKSPFDAITETAKLKEELNKEILEFALLQKIDFKFDDTSNKTANVINPSVITSNAAELSGIAKLEQAELEYENCFQATKDATRLLHKYATLAPKQSTRIKQQLQQHLQINQSSSLKPLMTQSTKLDSPTTNTDMSGSSATRLGTKKFASIPRFKKIDFSPLKLKINNVLQRNHIPDY